MCRRILAINQFLLIFWWMPQSASSFVIRPTRSIPYLMVDRKGKESLQQTFLCSSSSIKATGLNLANSPKSPPTTEKQIELWLDLRGTAVHPRVAVDYILEELQQQQQEKITTAETRPATINEESSSTMISPNKLIDKVLLSDGHFQNLVESLDPYTQIKDVLYIPEQNHHQQEKEEASASSSADINDKEGSGSQINAKNTLVALSRNGVSFPFGNLIGVPRGDDVATAIADPIEAIQDLSKGNWILFVSEDEKTESIQQLNAMGSFLDIASTASLSWSSTTQLESGLLVHSQRQHQQLDDEEEEENQQQQPSSSNNKSSCGGVAIKCSTRESVLQLASIFQTTLSASTKTTKTTESGILIQESPEYEEEDAGNAALPLAMILPFDMSLWEAASLLYGDDEDQYVMGE